MREWLCEEVKKEAEFNGEGCDEEEEDEKQDVFSHGASLVIVRVHFVKFLEEFVSCFNAV